MKLEPLGRRVVTVEHGKGDATRDSGIIVPEVAQQNEPVLATVMEVGDLECESIKHGTEILAPRYAGTRMVVPGKDGADVKILILDEKDILCIVHEEA